MKTTGTGTSTTHPLSSVITKLGHDNAVRVRTTVRSTTVTFGWGQLPNELGLARNAMVAVVGVEGVRLTRPDGPLAARRERKEFTAPRAIVVRRSCHLSRGGLSA